MTLCIVTQAANIAHIEHEGLICRQSFGPHGAAVRHASIGQRSSAAEYNLVCTISTKTSYHEPIKIRLPFSKLLQVGLLANTDSTMLHSTYPKNPYSQ